MSYSFSHCSHFIFGLYILLFFLLPVEGIAQNNESADCRIVAYAGGDMDMWQMDASKITHINYAFANVNEDGEIYFRNEAAG